MTWTNRAWLCVKNVANSGWSDSANPVTTARLNKLGQYILSRYRRTSPRAAIFGDASRTMWKIVFPV